MCSKISKKVQKIHQNHISFTTKNKQKYAKLCFSNLKFHFFFTNFRVHVTVQMMRRLHLRIRQNLRPEKMAKH